MLEQKEIDNARYMGSVPYRMRNWRFETPLRHVEPLRTILKADIANLAAIDSPLPNKLREGLFGYTSTVLVDKALKYSYF